MIRSLPIASSSRMPGVHWCAVHTAPVGAENPIPPAQATSRYSWMSPVGAENVIRPSGEGRCISRPVVSHRLTTVAHLVRPRVGSCVCAATTSPLIAKIGLTHSIASIHSSCPQGRMRFSAPHRLPCRWDQCFIPYGTGACESCMRPERPFLGTLVPAPSSMPSWRLQPGAAHLRWRRPTSAPRVCTRVPWADGFEWPSAGRGHSYSTPDDVVERLHRLAGTI
jgi:hypothetical protein